MHPQKRILRFFFFCQWYLHRWTISLQKLWRGLCSHAQKGSTEDFEEREGIEPIQATHVLSLTTFLKTWSTLADFWSPRSSLAIRHIVLGKISSTCDSHHITTVKVSHNTLQTTPWIREQNPHPAETDSNVRLSKCMEEEVWLLLQLPCNHMQDCPLPLIQQGLNYSLIRKIPSHYMYTFKQQTKKTNPEVIRKEISWLFFSYLSRVIGATELKISKRLSNNYHMLDVTRFHSGKGQKLRVAKHRNKFIQNWNYTKYEW